MLNLSIGHINKNKKYVLLQDDTLKTEMGLTSLKIDPSASLKGIFLTETSQILNVRDPDVIFSIWLHKKDDVVICTNKHWFLCALLLYIPKMCAAGD